MDLESSSHELLIDDLLEDYWFFENLFTKKSRILRYCHSDPYPSSSSSSLTSPVKIEHSDPIKILEDSTERCLINTPSIYRKEGGSISGKIRVQEQRQVGSFLQKKVPINLPKSGSCSAPGKIQEPSTRRCLIRTPSLPPRVEKREADREAKRMINKLTRQFSEKIRVLEPTRPSERFLHDKKSLVQDKEISERNRTGGPSSVKISLHRSRTMPSNIIRREEEDEIEDQESDSRMGFLIREAISSSHNSPNVTRNQRQKPPRRDLRSEETVVVKLQVNSSPKTLRKTLSSIDQHIKPRVMPGLDTPPKVPKDSRKEMKDQIKFWARAVATNVKQEC